MPNIFLPAKLLLCLVGRGKGEHLVSVSKSAGARGGTIVLARSVGDNPILQALSLADVHQDMVITLMGKETQSVTEAIRKAAAAAPRKLGGMATLLDVSGMLVRNATEEQRQQAQQERAGRYLMESGYELINIIVNAGYADDVMTAARKAGATGGTILTGRGTGTEEDVKFFGISLVPEKEILMIVAARDKVQGILDAVNTVPNLCKPGGGIVFNLNVEEFIVLGK